MDLNELINELCSYQYEKEWFSQKIVAKLRVNK